MEIRCENPGLTYLQNVVTSLHGSHKYIDDDKIDTLLGLPKLGWEQEALDGNHFLTMQDGRREHVLYQGTPYRCIREAIQWAQPTPDDVVMDLGCGYGKFCFYGSLATSAQYRGIELADSRINLAQGVKERFGIPNIQFIKGNVLDQDLSEGTIFYMFNPFTIETLDQVLKKLKTVSTIRPIRIISYYTWLINERAPYWLAPIKRSSQERDLVMYSSSEQIKLKY